MIGRGPAAGAWIVGATFMAGALLTSGVPAQQDDLSGFRHIHSLAIPDRDSPLFGFHHFYVNETGRQVFLDQGPFPYPEGTVFLGAVYEAQQGDGQINEGSGMAYTVMRKDPAATETGGWRFSQLDAEGRPMEIDPVGDCFECHEPQAATDYVFSEPLGLRLPPPSGGG